MEALIAITCSSIGRAEDQQSDDSEFEPHWGVGFDFLIFSILAKATGYYWHLW